MPESIGRRRVKNGLDAVLPATPGEAWNRLAERRLARGGLRPILLQDA
jgi:hypothetical protein